MDWVLVINTASGLMSLVLGGFAIWLALNLYTKAKDTEREVAKSLEAIRAQSDALQRLTGRWMDRFTRHATEPRPADQGLMQLVQTVAALPTTILTHLHIRTQPDLGASEQLLREVVDGYVGLYYYSALANVLGQGLLPSEDQFNPDDPLHSGIQALIDRTAGDFQYMESVLAKLDQNRVKASSLNHLLEEALTRWRPYVRYTSQSFEARRTTGGEG